VAFDVYDMDITTVANYNKLCDIIKFAFSLGSLERWLTCFQPRWSGGAESGSGAQLCRQLWRAHRHQ
jgi:hypothetical protein